MRSVFVKVLIKSFFFLVAFSLAWVMFAGDMQGLRDYAADYLKGKVVVIYWGDVEITHNHIPGTATFEYNAIFNFIDVAGKQQAVSVWAKAEVRKKADHTYEIKLSGYSVESTTTRISYQDDTSWPRMVVYMKPWIVTDLEKLGPEEKLAVQVLTSLLRANVF